uniref:Secreted protein n=1 Tax=Romanomermis culicivorax TaxID=13658 RepID=A0A915HRZ9_ROMCU
MLMCLEFGVIVSLIQCSCLFFSCSVVCYKDHIKTPCYPPSVSSKHSTDVRAGTRYGAIGDSQRISSLGKLVHFYRDITYLRSHMEFVVTQ